MFLIEIIIDGNRMIDLAVHIAKGKLYKKNKITMKKLKNSIYRHGVFTQFGSLAVQF